MIHWLTFTICILLVFAVYFGIEAIAEFLITWPFEE